MAIHHCRSKSSRNTPKHRLFPHGPLQNTSFSNPPKATRPSRSRTFSSRAASPSPRRCTGASGAACATPSGRRSGVSVRRLSRPSIEARWSRHETSGALPPSRFGKFSWSTVWFFSRGLTNWWQRVLGCQVSRFKHKLYT